MRVLGASAYRAEGAEHIIASEDTRALIVERGQFDKDSEIGRFPRLIQDLQSVPEGLTWPTLTFQQKMTLWLGQLEVQILQPGRGHTKGDTVAWLPEEKILFSGDLVEFGATPYADDAYFRGWPTTLERIAALQPEKLVPGRGAALQTPAQVQAGLVDHARIHQRAVPERPARRCPGRRPASGVPGDVCQAAAPIRPVGDLQPLHAV